VELIIQVDGGHIPIQDPEKRSFEALSAIVYRPENLHAGTNTIAKLLRLVLFPQGMTIYKPSRFI